MNLLVSVCQAQTAGRGSTRRSLLNLHDLHCLILPRGSPTASASAAATRLVSASHRTPLKPPPSATSLVGIPNRAPWLHNSSNVFGNKQTFWPTDIPSAPGKVVPTRNTDTSVVVSWEASRDAKELVGYYIEGSVVGSNVWEPCNNKPVNCSR